jgi:hypothetical protein
MNEMPTRFAQISADQTRDAVWQDVVKAIEKTYQA